METEKGVQIVEFSGLVNESLASAIAQLSSQDELYLEALYSLYDQFLTEQNKPTLTQQKKDQLTAGIMNLHPQVRGIGINGYLEEIGKTQKELLDEYNNNYKTGTVFIGETSTIQFTLIPSNDSFEISYIEGIGDLGINKSLEAIYL